VASILGEKDLVGFWEPPKEVITAVEARIRPALEVARTKPETLFDSSKGEYREEFSWGVSVKAREILEAFGGYRCQYLGIVVKGGHRRVFVNCFGKDNMIAYDQSWFDHTKIDDGGARYWRIWYDVDTCRFLDFEVNADA
jgi:hypothetical protein